MVRKLLKPTGAVLAVACLASASVVGLPHAAGWAMGGAPDTPKVDCRKKKNKKKPECKKKKRSDNGAATTAQLSDEERYRAGYWLARSGRFADAMAQFKAIAAQDTARVQNYLGFTSRKLGKLDQAMRHYRRALEIDPGYTLARAYMGEAFLKQGDVGAARAQLAEIAQRCGVACEEHVRLAGQIRDFTATGRFTDQDAVLPPARSDAGSNGSGRRRG